MCEQLKIINGFKVACRKCGKCLQTRHNTWTARALAERDENAFCYSITLTYANDANGKAPLGARLFNYSDVQLWLKRVRQAGVRNIDAAFTLRYLIAGEWGSTRGRVHYHCILFTSHPIEGLGKYEGAKTEGFAFKRRLAWTLWPHGFVEVQEGDKQSIRYTLKYILKNQFNAKAAEGTRHEGKTEWLSGGLFRMSLKPAIGHSWLWRKLNEMWETGTCPRSLRIRVPGGGGDWYLSGPIQEEVCIWLHHRNKEFYAKRGRNLAAWNTLIGSLEPIENVETGEMTNPKAKEWLLHGEETEATVNKEYVEKQWEKYKTEYARKKRTAAPITNSRAIVRQCGNVLPCEKCKRSLRARHLANIEQEQKLWFEEWQHRNPQSPKVSDLRYREAFEGWWRTRLRPSRGCQLRDTPEHREAFDRLRPLEKANPETRHRKGIAPSLQGKAKRPPQNG